MAGGILFSNSNSVFDGHCVGDVTFQERINASVKLLAHSSTAYPYTFLLIHLPPYSFFSPSATRCLASSFTINPFEKLFYNRHRGIRQRYVWHVIIKVNTSVCGCFTRDVIQYSLKSESTWYASNLNRIEEVYCKLIVTKLCPPPIPSRRLNGWWEEGRGRRNVVQNVPSYDRRASEKRRRRESKKKNK